MSSFLTQGIRGLISRSLKQTSETLRPNARKILICRSEMSLHHRNGAYGALGIKIISYLMIQQVSCSTRLTFHQIKLQLSGERQMLSIISAHFHELNTQEYL
ncbi:MAG: hypothetical protein OXC79_01085 [Candidatus Poribacteria bacterium]|nr:hypothetical protein [Candidatus Poribacteria bacterium]